MAFENYSHHIVPGEGPVPCRLMLLAEAPGADEDRLSRPLIGASGRLSDQLLTQAGLQRAGVYLDNVSQRRPPGNRAPTGTEIKALRESLMQRIATVQPAVIVAYGDTALKALVGKTGITKHRGVELKMADPSDPGRFIHVLPTFHPAYALRNPAVAATIIKDLRRAKLLAEGGPATAVTSIYKILHLGSVAPPILEDAPVAAYDVETTSLDPRTGTLLGIGIAADPTCVFYFPWPVGEAWLRKWFATPRRYVAHNGKFDNRWLKKHGILVQQTFDTMLAAVLLDENRSSYKLERLAVEDLGVEPYHADTDEALSSGHGADIPTDMLARRCGRDAAYTLQLYLQYKQALEADPRLRRVFQALIMPISRLLEDVEDCGLPIDLDLMDEREALLGQAATVHEQAMQKFVGMSNINFNSTKVIANILYERLGLPRIKFTPGGKPSTDKEVLLELRDQSPFVQHLIDYRKCQKYKSTYFERWRERVT